MSNQCPLGCLGAPAFTASLNFTNHLYKAMMVKCYINACKNTRTVIRVMIQKIRGESEFKGQHFNQLVWCDIQEAQR